MELLTLAVIGLGAAVGLGLFAVLSQAEEKAVVRASLRQLDDYEVESVREKEFLAPIRDPRSPPSCTGSPASASASRRRGTWTPPARS